MSSTLDEVIRQLINLGEKDPLVIARKIEEREDEKWLRDELYALREDTISEMARGRLNGARHSAMKALRKGQPQTKAELLIKGEWVPNFGWKKLADWTAADLRARENYYLKISGTAHKLATWCHECVVLMEVEGVKTLGKLKAELPELAKNGRDILENDTSIEDAA